MPRKKRIKGSDFDKPFPQTLRHLFDEQGKTQQELADYLEDKSRQVVGYYCDGSSSPDWETLVKIADFFNVSLDYLVGRSNTKTLDTSIQAACKVTGLSEDSIGTLRFMMHLATCGGTSDSNSCRTFATDSKYAFDAVNEFIEFVCSECHHYFNFRSYTESHHKYLAQYEKMTPQEKQEALQDKFVRFGTKYSYENTFPMDAKTAANYFRTNFCDEFKYYLKNKYPLDKPKADTKED